MRMRSVCTTLIAVLTLCAGACAQSSVSMHLAITGQPKHAELTAVIWLKPIGATPSVPFVPAPPYTLMQKNRMFVPHLLVIPVGAVVSFPNKDPFFHNVFSLFDGKRFDLGLYEAGTSKQVTFGREGISYIFCNIHPEMSAVVVALATPFYGIADGSGNVVVRNVPAGDFRLQMFVQGVPQPALDAASRTVHVGGAGVDLGTVALSARPVAGHRNKFGQSYAPSAPSTY